MLTVFWTGFSPAWGSLGLSASSEIKYYVSYILNCDQIYSNIFTKWINH